MATVGVRGLDYGLCRPCGCRSATGEAWQDIMMACSNKASVVCDEASDSAGQRCGSGVAFPFFISFYILCSFLVSTRHSRLHVFTVVTAIVMRYDDQSVKLHVYNFRFGGFGLL